MNSIRSILLACAIVSLGGWSIAPAQAAEKERHVVVVSLDGLALYSRIAIAGRFVFGCAPVYCTNPGDAPQRAADFKQMFLGKEGVADVLLPDQFGEVGLQHPREYRQSPDAILVAADGYAVSGSVAGDTLVASNAEAKTSIGSHGFLASVPKMKALCVLSGAGIRPGTKLETIGNIDIAPTIAHLLGVEYPSVDGKPLAAVMQ